jgi:hypothetical protein
MLLILLLKKGIRKERKKKEGESKAEGGKAKLKL